MAPNWNRHPSTATSSRSWRRRSVSGEAAGQDDPRQDRQPTKGLPAQVFPAAGQPVPPDHGRKRVGFQAGRTRMVKSVLDAGWSMLRGYLRYKNDHAGVPIWKWMKRIQPEPVLRGKHQRPERAGGSWDQALGVRRLRFRTSSGRQRCAEHRPSRVRDALSEGIGKPRRSRRGHHLNFVQEAVMHAVSYPQAGVFFCL